MKCRMLESFVYSGYITVVSQRKAVLSRLVFNLSRLCVPAERQGGRIKVTKHFPARNTASSET